MTTKAKIDCYTFLRTPTGQMRLGQTDGHLTLADFSPDIPDGALLAETDVLRLAARQITEYFDGTRQAFDLPILLRGTDFQLRVWQELCRIPYGKTVSYGELAVLIGSPNSARAVGMANHNNPVCIIVPCHRVIGADGRLVGYGGGLNIKEYLLRLEKEHSCSNEN